MGIGRRLAAGAALWWRSLRQQRVTRDGWFYIAFSLVVGTAALNTGNNLLYLVLGLQLSLIILSSFLSESSLRGLTVERTLPRDATAGEAIPVVLTARNSKRRLPSLSLVLTELAGPAANARVFVDRVPASGACPGSYRLTVPRRGEVRFGAVLVTTTFPFGLFEKSRQHDLPQPLVVHPARRPAPRATSHQRSGEGERPEPRPGQGRDFHSLRDHRYGDDPRSVHWPSTARSGRLLVVERERERRRRISLLVETRGARAPEALDGNAELAAALSRRYIEAGYEVGLSWAGGSVEPGAGPGQLRRLLGGAALLSPAPAGASAPKAHRNAEVILVPAAPARPGGAPVFEPLQPASGSTGEGKLTLRNVQRFAVHAAVGTAFGSVVMSGELPLIFTALLVAGTAIGLLSREAPPRGLRIAANLLAVMALLVLGTLVGRRVLEIYVAAPAFAVALAASRLLARSGARDDSLLLLSALLMLAGGAALTGELAFGAWFAAFAGCSTVALSLTHLRRNVESIGGLSASRRRGTVSAGLVGALALLSLTALAGSAAVFLLFPRVPTHLLARASRDRAGAPERIRLGGTGTLKEDPTPAMHVRFPGGKTPPELYWRSVVFERWDGKEWSRREDPGLQVTTQAIGQLPVPPMELVDANVELLLPERALPTPGEAVTVRFPRRPYQSTPILLQRRDGTLEVRSAFQQLAYQVRAAAPLREPGLRGLGRDYPPELAWATEVPGPIDPRVRALAAEFAAIEDPWDAASALTARLEQDYAYSRELPGDSEDPLARFLFETRRGHCEFFASSLAVLLRLQGIPARVAAGYYGASPVEGEDYSVVRVGDAHAWTEVFFPGRGWVRFDATPPSDRAGEVQGLYSALVAAWDLVRGRWLRWVVDYSEQEQLALATGVARLFSSKEHGERKLAGVARFGIGLVALAGALLLLPRLRRGLRRRALVAPEHREAVRLFQEVKRALGQRGIVLAPAATADDWAAAALRAGPGTGRAAAEAIDAYQAARFGGAGLDPGTARRLALAVRAAARAA